MINLTFVIGLPYAQVNVGISCSSLYQCTVSQEFVMSLITSQEMGQVTTTVTVANRVDEILAERGFIPSSQVRCITKDNVLVGTGATILCLPEEIK